MRDIVCQVDGCGAVAEISIRYAMPSGLRRYCARCAVAAARQVRAPKVVLPDWWTPEDLGDQAADAGRCAAVRCRVCAMRWELDGPAATCAPARCPSCSADSDHPVVLRWWTDWVRAEGARQDAAASNRCLH